MSIGGERRVCGLITQSLAFSSSAVGKGNLVLGPYLEKDLLVSLSSVSREIRRFSTTSTSTLFSSCVCHMEEHNNNFNCLANVVTSLVHLLTLESSYVQHSVVNVLLSISDFLTKSESSWMKFMNFLWICLESSTSSLLFLPSHVQSVNTATGTGSTFARDSTFQMAGDSDHDTKKFLSLLNPSVLKFTYPTVTNLVRVIGVIIKRIKHRHENHMQAYLCHAVHSLAKIPWDSLKIMHNDQKIDATTNPTDQSLHLNFFGALLQLLCSWVGKKDSEEAGVLADAVIFSTFTSLVPKLLRCCFFKHEKYNYVHIMQYLKHKALMLMIRLSFSAHWKNTSTLLWLELLKEHFEDLLYMSISQCYATHINALDGSPFQAAAADNQNVHGYCTCHLQRQVIFLFVKCCCKLAPLTNESDREYEFSSENSPVSQAQYDMKKCCSNILVDLSEWLRLQGFLAVGDRDYSISRRRFSLSFLHLYMDEDDGMFEILLQLLDSPFANIEGKNVGSIKLYEVENKGSMSCISEMFNPIHLFHLFLSLLHYDHSVLLDYLISKDTGIQCAEYLLRCLRIVCKSWFFFVEFSHCEDELEEVHSKSCSTPTGDYVDKVKSLSSSTEGCDGVGYDDRKNRYHKIGSKRKIGSHAFEAAKGCLLSLKTSVEDLQRKDLFPYNPSVLLRSLGRFADLCQQQEDA